MTFHPANCRKTRNRRRGTGYPGWTSCLSFCGLWPRLQPSSGTRELRYRKRQTRATGVCLCGDCDPRAQHLLEDTHLCPWHRLHTTVSGPIRGLSGPIQSGWRTGTLFMVFCGACPGRLSRRTVARAGVFWPSSEPIIWPYNHQRV